MSNRLDQTAPVPSSLRENRDFQAVLAGQAVSAFGDAITLTAMPLFVLALTGSGALMGVVGALQLVPDLVLGLPAGALADRWDRRRMMMWADTGRAVLTAAIPFSYWLGWSTIAAILIVAVPTNALRVLSDAAYTSAVPGLVGREHLARASSYMEATLSVPFIVGPAVAGILVATIGPATTVAIDAASFAVSAGSLAVVRRTLRAERPAEMPRFLVDIKDGIGFVWRHVVLRTIIAYWGSMAAATAALIPALGYYITIDRDFGPELFGFVGSAWSVGYLLGSLLAGRLSGEIVGLRMLASGVVIGACLVVVAVTASATVYLAVGFCIGIAVAVQTVSYMTLRPALTPDELLGRVGSTARTITVGLRPLGQLGGGALIAAASGGVALMGMGSLAIGASILFGLSKTFREAGRQAR
jgi:ENTS family enterobactin (siderophore) exporter